MKHIILVGGGHSHAIVIRHWHHQAVKNVRLTLISPQRMTPYSGMLPGLIAGHYQFDQTHIDLKTLAQWAGIDFIEDAVTAVNAEARTVSLKQGRSLNYDWLSIDIGSTPDLSIQGAEQFSTPVKPIHRFYQRWQSIQQQLDSGALTSITVIGGGAGSVEVILAIAEKLRKLNQSLELNLLTAAELLLPGYPVELVDQVKRQFHQYEIQLYSAARVNEISRDNIRCENGLVINSGMVIVCTQARGAEWLKDSALDCDERGFINVRPTLQTIQYDRIFAAGDIANMVQSPRPKAGVYAVRQGKILLENLAASVRGEDLIDYKPQDDFLSLLALGEKKAVGCKFVFSFSGTWVWYLKNWIDQRFMQQFFYLS